MTIAAITVHASTLASALNCPLRWAAAQDELNIPTGRKRPQTAPTVIGSAVHLSTAVFDRGEADVNNSAGVAVDYVNQPKDEVDWGEVTKKDAIKRALGVHTTYCNDIAPQRSYVEVEQELNPLEIPVAPPGRDDVEVLFTLMGTLDRVRQESGLLGVCEIKTGQRACSQSSGRHRGQLAAYQVLAEQQETPSVEFKLPGELLQLQTSMNWRARARLIEGSHIEALTRILKTLALYIANDHYPGDPSSWLCSQKYCQHFHHCTDR